MNQGKYDLTAATMAHAYQAKTVFVMIEGGHMGDGCGYSGTEDIDTLPNRLRLLANEIERANPRLRNINPREDKK
jgi:hypothetical protein